MIVIGDVVVVVVVVVAAPVVVAVHPNGNDTVILVDPRVRGPERSRPVERFERKDIAAGRFRPQNCVMGELAVVASNGLCTSHGPASPDHAVRPVDPARLARAVREMLIAIGEDPDRPGLVDTPARVARALIEQTDGLRADPGLHLRRTFEEGHGDLVLMRDLEFSSLCEHHLLPFTGVAHVAYLPSDRRVVGLSKIARALDACARKPQVQERLGHELATAFEVELAPRGVAVVLEAEHQCMALRGARKRGAITTTVTTRGVFATEPGRTSELLQLIRGAGSSRSR